MAPTTQSPDFVDGQAGPFSTLDELRRAVRPAEHKRSGRLTALIDNRLITDPDGTNPSRALLDIRRLLQAGEVPETDDDLVDLALALSDAAIRDACIGLVLTEPRGRSESLWLALTQTLPAPERAEPAVLLAASAFRRGNQALCRAAAEALAAVPAHPIAALLHDACQRPDTWPAVLSSLRATGSGSHTQRPQSSAHDVTDR